MPGQVQEGVGRDGHPAVGHAGEAQAAVRAVLRRLTRQTDAWTDAARVHAGAADMREGDA